MGSASASLFSIPGVISRSMAATEGGITSGGRKLRGRIADGVYAFKGIPYGAPASGANPSMPPKLREPWTGVRDTFEYAHYTRSPIGRAAVARCSCGRLFRRLTGTWDRWSFQSQALVAVSQGIGLGPHGEGHVRFALVENDQRIRQAVAGIKSFLRS